MSKSTIDIIGHIWQNENRRTAVKGGYYHDYETGFYYLQSRYYDPVNGRFLNADGYVNANGDLIGFNMYAYCGNNPVMGYDPTGAAGEENTIWMNMFLTKFIAAIVNDLHAYDEESAIL